MFYNLNDSKNGIIKSISIDLNKLDKDVREHLEETLKGKVKITDNKFIIKTEITLEQLRQLNAGYNEFHSKFIDENIIVPIKQNLKSTKEQNKTEEV